jgi:hypothetical protein
MWKTKSVTLIVGNPDSTVSGDRSVVGDTEGGHDTATVPSSSDATPPAVTLVGSAAVSLAEGDAFADPGATAFDDIDDDITMRIIKTGTVDTATAGVYTLSYSATDAAGNMGTASRLVSVVPVSVPPAAP